MRRTGDRRVGAAVMAVGAVAAVIGAIGVATAADDEITAGPDTAPIPTTPSPPTTPATPPETTTRATSTPAPASDTRESTSAGNPAPTPQSPESFVTEILLSGLRSGDVDILFDRLHPDVLGVYGDDACSTYLPTVVDAELSLIVDSVGESGPWEWVADGVVIDIDEALPVAITLTAKGNTQMQELHLVDIEGEWRWFTDCGDPLTGAAG